MLEGTDSLRQMAWVSPTVGAEANPMVILDHEEPLQGLQRCMSSQIDEFF